jgi:hypothetical protein
MTVCDQDRRDSRDVSRAQGMAGARAGHGHVSVSRDVGRQRAVGKVARHGRVARQGGTAGHRAGRVCLRARVMREHSRVSRVMRVVRDTSRAQGGARRAGSRQGGNTLISQCMTRATWHQHTAHHALPAGSTVPHSRPRTRQHEASGHRRRIRFDLTHPTPPPGEAPQGNWSTGQNCLHPDPSRFSTQERPGRSTF